MRHADEALETKFPDKMEFAGCGGGGVGQLGMAHRSDGPASSLRMFGHVHRAMCGGGCQFEELEEHACT